MQLIQQFLQVKKLFKNTYFNNNSYAKILSDNKFHNMVEYISIVIIKSKNDITKLIKYQAEFYQQPTAYKV